MNTSTPENLRRIRQRIQRTLLAIAALILVGVIGYVLIERWSFFDALYMTVITLAGVGYQETHPLDWQGRLFTIVLILLGVTALGFLISQVLQAVNAGYFRDSNEYNKRQRMVNKLTNHFIVCGFGRMGRRVCEEFAKDGAPFVVIEADAVAYEAARAKGYLVFQGDASTDQLLIEAAIERAKCIVCSLPSDAGNLFIIISARNLNPKIRTITRASTDESAIKLKRGGADEVISPYDTGARRMASIALRPGVVDFVETAITGNNRQFYIEEFKLDPETCPYIGKQLQDTDFRTQSGALVLAIRRLDGNLIGGPTGDTVLQAEDLLFCLGSAAQLRTFASLLLPLNT